MHHILNYKLIIDYHDDLICAAICYATVRELVHIFTFSSNFRVVYRHTIHLNLLSNSSIQDLIM